MLGSNLKHLALATAAGKTLDQGIITIAIAQTYLVRFFAIKPYQRNDSFIVAVAALFVASKTENKPRALADIAHACWRHWSASFHAYLNHASFQLHEYNSLPNFVTLSAVPHWHMFRNSLLAPCTL